MSICNPDNPRHVRACVCESRSMSLETRGGDEIKQTVILSIPPLSAKLDMGD